MLFLLVEMCCRSTVTHIMRFRKNDSFTNCHLFILVILRSITRMTVERNIQHDSLLVRMSWSELTSRGGEQKQQVGQYTSLTPKQKVQRSYQATLVWDRHFYRQTFNNTKDKIGRLAARAYLISYNSSHAHFMWHCLWPVDLLFILTLSSGM